MDESNGKARERSRSPVKKVVLAGDESRCGRITKPGCCRDDNNMTTCSASVYSDYGCCPLSQIENSSGIRRLVSKSHDIPVVIEISLSGYLGISPETTPAQPTFKDYLLTEQSNRVCWYLRSTNQINAYAVLSVDQQYHWTLRKFKDGHYEVILQEDYNGFEDDSFNQFYIGVHQNARHISPINPSQKTIYYDENGSVGVSSDSTVKGILSVVN